MNRPRHSDAGQLRLMQMSESELFVFVEGTQTDPYFYAELCASIPELEGRYEICPALQLPGGTGGKSALLSFFSFLRRKKALISGSDGDRTTCIFFLDKDVDDLMRTMKRSQHVIYTEHYDVQNYVFMHGNLLIGAASAASVDRAKLRAELNDAPRWCRHIVEQWREWITLCLCVLENQIRYEANYGDASPVQTRPCGQTDPTRYAALIQNLARRCELTVAGFKKQLAATTRKVDKYFAAGQHHRIFKGKWFATILADDIDRVMGARPYHSNGLVSRLGSAVSATLDFTEPWTDHFKDPIRNVTAVL